jgi:hypothetical protein
MDAGPVGRIHYGYTSRIRLARNGKILALWSPGQRICIRRHAPWQEISRIFLSEDVETGDLEFNP